MRIALAPAAAIECDAPRRNVHRGAGGEQTRRGAGGRRRHQQCQPGDRPRHGGPQVADQSPADQEGDRRDGHPHRGVADDQRAVLAPAVRAGQHAEQRCVHAEPGEPGTEQSDAQQPRLGEDVARPQRRRADGDHRGDRTDENGHPHRMDPRPFANSADVDRRHLLGLPDFAGGLLKQAVGGSGEQPEGAPEHGEDGESRRFQVPRGEVEHRIAAQRAQHGRHADAGEAALGGRSLSGDRRRAVGHRSGTSVEYNQACHSGRSDSFE